MPVYLGDVAWRSWAVVVGAGEVFDRSGTKGNQGLLTQKSPESLDYDGFDRTRA